MTSRRSNRGVEWHLRLVTLTAGLLTALAVWLGLQRVSDIANELLALLFLVLAGVGTTTIVWMMHAWRDEESLERASFASGVSEPTLSFSLIIPARHEASVLPATLDKLARQDHPLFEVLIVIAEHDTATREAARLITTEDDRFRVILDSDLQRNKAMALNRALPHCRGDIVGVFDAEDIVAESLLRAVDQQFARSQAEIVQGGAQLMNFKSSWYSVRNVLEYYFWFRSRLHFHANAGFIPLGGNTIFVRRAWLLAVDGWDEHCLAEDCDLGARLSAVGARTVVAYSPELATREETPESIGALVRQRTRWNQGFLQVLRKGDWRILPWRPRLLAAYTLSFPFLQAAMALILPFAVLAVFVLRLPITLALLSFVPAVPLACILVAELVGLHDFGREYGVRPRLRDYLKLIVGLIPYQLILGYAALRAVWRELNGVNNWEKTEHVGAHL